MKIILAEALGMCFGVRDALAAMRRIEQPVHVTVLGELVHNRAVNDEVRSRGFHVLDSGDTGGPEEVATPRVLITAHGASDREKSRWMAAGKTVVDTTCPLVRRAHAAAVELARQGRFVIICGRRGHVEVRGLAGDLPEHAVVESVEQVRCYERPLLGVIAQTTAIEAEVAAIVERVREKNASSDVRFVNTVCAPTRDRQAALERLVERVDALVVVGGRNSNNTRQLAETARRLGASRGVRVWHIEHSGELDGIRFLATDAIGVTAGTSVLPETIDAVVEKLETMAAGVPALIS